MAQAIRIIQKKGTVNRQINKALEKAMQLIMENREKAKSLKLQNTKSQVIIAA